MFAHQILSLGFRHLKISTQIEFSSAVREVGTESECYHWLQAKARALGHARSAVDHIQQNVESLLCAGWQITYPGAGDFPNGLYRLLECPIFLAYKGKALWSERPSISVVGGREPGIEALSWMENELGAFLKKIPLLVCSGGARGVDQKAHALSLLCGRPTVVFLPSGAKHLYPPVLERWVGLILEQDGALMSEYLPDTPMHKVHFQERNRLIATFSKVLLVVQCRERSGSLITAQAALPYGIPVGAVPWSPLEARACGSNRLIYEGAQMIRDALDLEIFCGFNSRPVSPKTH